MQQDLIDNLNKQFAERSLASRLQLITKYFPSAVFTTSLGPEDQVITHMLATTICNMDIATLNTGRLFQQTMALLDKTRARYALEIKEYHPNEKDINQYIAQYGLNGFYDSVQGRHACCHVRKIIPLQKALEGRTAWVTGLRRAQSHNRIHIPFVEWSDDYQLMKFNPIADWSAQDMQSAIEFNNIPINPLHQKNYASIGCEPCTRAIKHGEDERAGRWWWEQDQKRECGLHVAAKHAKR